MIKNTYMRLNVQVCGQETLTLVQSSKRSIILGEQSGDPNSMSESERYYTIPQSTFQSYFTVSSSVCTIDRYEIRVQEASAEDSSAGLLADLGLSLSTLSSTTNSVVSLTGSLGSIKMKVDKTAATGTETVYLKAITRGDVSIEQEFEFQICPKEGGVNITIPAEDLPKSRNATSGQILNLPLDAQYYQMDRYKTGTSANLPFDAWAIADVYPGCGTFWKYAISGETSSTNYL